MPRRSSRVVSQPAEAPAQAPKRRPSAPLATATSATKSKKQKPEPATTKDKPIRSTTKKSKYFENSAPEESESESQSESAEDTGSAFEDTRSTSPVPSPEATERASTNGNDDEEEKPKQNKRGGCDWAHGKKRKSKVDDNNAEAEEEIEALKGKELWREGVRTGLGPGKEIYIKIPHRKARDPGDTPYQDHTIHPNTMLFLQDLKKNNEREWLKAHDADYRASKRDWETFVETLTEKIIDKDSTIPELPTKDLVFRIHRDIRFSNDPTPYKAGRRTFQQLGLAPERKAIMQATTFTFSLDPVSSPNGLLNWSGLWMPEASKLALLREDIDRNSRRIKAVLNDAGMRREFFKGIPDDEEKAVKAFVSQNQENALKTKPKGYEQDNENIELLRLRNFTVGKPLPDAVLLSPNAQDTIAELVGIMVPFVTYLNSVVMPDPADESGEESDDG